jgi:hypothetical protein
VPAFPCSPIDRIAVHRVRGGPDVVTDVAAGPGLLAYLAAVPDPRHRRGVRHRLVAVVAVAVCAVLADARSFTAIGEWAADAPGEVLAALGVRADPWRILQPPDEATARRVLTDIDGDASTRRSMAGCVNWRHLHHRRSSRPPHARPGRRGPWTAKLCVAPAVLVGRSICSR